MSDHIYSAAWLLGVWTGPTFHLSSLAVSTFTAPPRLPRGGILGDEMGMGKTMVMLAVMLVNEMPFEERWKRLKHMERRRPSHGPGGSADIVDQPQVSRRCKPWPLSLPLPFGSRADARTPSACVAGCRLVVTWLTTGCQNELKSILRSSKFYDIF